MADITAPRHIPREDALRLLNDNRRAFDHVAPSRSVHGPRPRYGIALTVALALGALALVAFACAGL